MDGPSDRGLALRSLGVMGGTFDPIHRGHLVAASEALRRYSLDRVLFVPTGRPWQKSPHSSAEDRFVMTALATTSSARFGVSRIELDRRGDTYTADTMEMLRAFHGPHVRLYFIAGADAALRLGTWKKLERLGELAEIIAVTRPGFPLARLKVEPGWPNLLVMDMPGIDVSATDIRERVRSGRPIHELVPAAVVAYIAERGLYA